MTPPGPRDRDQRRPHTPPESVRAQTAKPLDEKAFPSEEDTDVGGDLPTRLEKRATNADRSSRAAFAAIKELRDDFKEHARADLEALDEIRADSKQTNSLLTELRITQAATVVELRALSSHIRQEQEHNKLRLIAQGEVQKVQTQDVVETNKFKREHKSKVSIQLLAIIGAAIVAIITALLTYKLKS